MVSVVEVKSESLYFYRKNGSEILSYDWSDFGFSSEVKYSLFFNHSKTQMKL